MEPNTTLLCLKLPFRAVPWTPSRTTKHRGTYKPLRLRQWQATIAQYARLHWGNRDPYDGPVEVRCRFEFAKGPRGDADNLAKAIVDATQGIIIVNDRQVVATKIEKSLHDLADMTMIEIRTA